MIASAKALTDRSSMAKQKNRKLARSGWIEGIIREARAVADSLQGCAPDQLHAHTNRLKRFLQNEADADDQRLLALAGGGVIESIRQTLGLNLFDVQIRAGIIVSCGAVAEMHTGEGKTLSGVLPAYAHALSQRGVHVATTNDYLASRDCERLTPIFDRLGMTVGSLSHDDTDEEARRAYQADVTYGPGNVFGFDYLKDQLTINGQKSGPIGSQVYRRLVETTRNQTLRQRGLHCAIVDEVDHVLLDDAGSPLLLSSSSQGEAPDAEIHLQAKAVAENLVGDVDYSVSANGAISLTAAGFDSVYQHDKWAVHDQLVRPWHEYVVLALRANKLFQRDVHYVVRDGEVQIVDASTGRIFEDRTWSEGLHQAILAAEGLEIIPETAALAKITRQRFFRYYQTLGGMTGTATGCEQEFRSVYGLPVGVVPLRIPTKRKVLAEQVCVTEADKMAAIGDEVESLSRTGHAVLVGTLNIAQSLLVAKELTQRGLEFQILNGIQDAAEAEIVSRAGRTGAITVATSLAGRGTDIALDDVVKELGGLHVIVTERHELARVDRQLIGRCARCGDPGTARFYLSAEDEIVAKHGPWIAKTVTRCADSTNPNTRNLLRQLARVQKACQEKAARARWQMLQTDQEKESLLDRDETPASCWQL